MMVERRAVRHTSVLVAGFVIVVLVLAGCGTDDEAESRNEGVRPARRGLEVSQVWARTSPAMATNGAVYLAMENHGNDDDALIAASVDASVAAKVELHETTAVAMGSTPTTMGSGMGSGSSGTEMMQMKPVAEIPIPAGRTVMLEPGGYHVMLLNLAKPLTMGSSITVKLTFRSGTTKTVSATVRDTAP
jgi:copper(I)-binding protein